MVCTGIDVTTFKPHSSRGVSTSKAFHLGSTLSDILKQGSWSNAKTFFNFYCREIEEDDGTETWIAMNVDCIYLSYIGIYGYIEKCRFYIYWINAS